MYYDGTSEVCPICGGKIVHQFTGLLEDTSQLDDEINNCVWIEVVDEGGGTIGYTSICKGKRKGK